MIRIPPLSLFLLLTLVFVGCKDNNNEYPGGDLSIEGKLDGASHYDLFFEELTPTDVIPLDTIQTDEQGQFKHTLHINHAGFYRLRASNIDFISLAASPGEKIQITARVSKLKESYKVSGSEGSQLLWHLNDMTLKGMEKTDSLRAVYRKSMRNPSFESVREELKNEYQQILIQQRQFVKEIIENNPNSLASVLALYHFFEDKLLLNEKEHFEYFEQLSQSLCTSYPHNKHVINLKKRVNDIKRETHQKIINEQNLATGNVAPEIILPDPLGNMISLSSLQGNLVLIDFWAAWCPPCRDANVVLGDLYKKFQPSGFEIYSISLDRTHDQWINAIEKDKVKWTQVSDLRFMNSPVVDLYNVNDIPHYILVDRQGNIISRAFNLQKLEALIQENI